MASAKPMGICEYLVANDYISEQQAVEALKNSSQAGCNFLLHLGKHEYIAFRKLAQAISLYFGFPFFDLDNYKINSKDILSTELIQKFNVIPIYQSDSYLYLGASDPSMTDLNEINFLTGLDSILIVVEADKLTKIISEFYLPNDHEELNIENKKEKNDLIARNNDVPISPHDASTVIPVAFSPIGFIDDVISEAIRRKASDIHFEPFDDYLRIRYRINGLLYEINHQPILFANAITTRLKVLANLDISERRIPQDGRFRFSIQPSLVHIRLSTCPTWYGEKAVLRLLASSEDILDINALGMEEHQQVTFEQAISSAQGLILITGPTGCGKTITIYSALKRLNTSHVNILSIEDPIEVILPGINQVQINKKAGLTFTKALRGFLRQDPDIIVIGEIRDLETAEIAIRAAQSGHLVLATIHTNSASETLIRLANLGISPYDIASSIKLIVAQRLARCLCIFCKTKTTLNPSYLLTTGFNPAETNESTLFKAQGCSQCFEGYSGRMGLFEILTISPEMSKLLSKTFNAITLQQQAETEGILDIRQVAINRVKQGLMSLEEYLRITKQSA